MHTPTRARTARAAAAALFSALLLAGTACMDLLPPVMADSDKVSEEVRRNLPLTADGEFELENINGSVEIEAWDRNEVEIVATKRAADQETLDMIEIVIEHTPTRISVETELPKGWHRSGSVSYIVKTPRGARIDADTVNGSMHIRGAEGPLDVASVNGAVEVMGAAGPVAAKTVNGSLKVDYARTPVNGGHSYKSVNGAIRVALPGDVSGRFEGDTVNGGIETDFPLQVHKAKYGPKRSMSGTLGSGGPDFDFQTVNGSIKVLRSGA